MLSGGLLRIPRMCGVVSIFMWSLSRMPLDSPHVRGCIWNYQKILFLGTGFPACAGLYLYLPSSSCHCLGIPRMCGVVSRLPLFPPGQHRNSPHVRGCIEVADGCGLLIRGFPACAGLYRSVLVWRHIGNRIPRMCGVVSTTTMHLQKVGLDSPYVRGCIEIERGSF